MENKRTPGPWKAAAEHSPRQGVYGCGYLVATMSGGEYYRDRANAILIAATPDLLAAAQDALIALEAAPDTVTTRIAKKKLKSAIESATS